VVFQGAGAGWELCVCPVLNAGHAALPLQGCSKGHFSPAGLNAPGPPPSIPPVFTWRGMKKEHP